MLKKIKPLHILERIKSKIKKLSLLKISQLSNRGLFRVYTASTKHQGSRANDRQLRKPSTASRVCITVENSSNSPSV